MYQIIAINKNGLKRRLGEVVFCGDFAGLLAEDKEGFYIKSELAHIRDCAIGNGDEIAFRNDISRKNERLSWPSYLVRM